ncbi:MAG TPA: sigma factor-like helix-turn-helix DNA-binding protein [Planctomycetota bacterium]|nr:sigma factor-like helix-turn-helix DNA-binding protein [Planctomycetota bacterium]
MNADDLATQEEFDRLFAESAGPYLRVYLTLQLRGRDHAVSVTSALEEVYAALLATGALIFSGERNDFQTRVYRLVDKVLPHLGQPALRRPRPPELEARARRFAELVEETWHGGFDDQVRALRSLSVRELEAVLLRDFHGWTMQEIARRLELPLDEARAFVRASQDRVRAWKAPELPVAE